MDIFLGIFRKCFRALLDSYSFHSNTALTNAGNAVVENWKTRNGDLPEPSNTYQVFKLIVAMQPTEEMNKTKIVFDYSLPGKYSTKIQ